MCYKKENISKNSFNRLYALSSIGFLVNLISIFIQVEIPYARHYNLRFVYFISTHFLKVKTVFSRSFFFQKILPLCMVSIKERVMMARVQYNLLVKQWHYSLMGPALSSQFLLKNYWAIKIINRFKKGFGPVVVNHALSAHYRAIESQMQKAKVICSNSMMNVTSKDMTSKAHYCVCTW